MELMKLCAILLCVLGTCFGRNIKLHIWTEGRQDARVPIYECRERPFTVAAVKHIAFDAPYDQHTSGCSCRVYPVTLDAGDLHNVSLDVSFMTSSKSYPASEWAESERGFPRFDLHDDVLQVVFHNDSLTESYSLHDSEVRITNGSATYLICGANADAVVPPMHPPSPPETNPTTDTPEHHHHHDESCPCFCTWSHCYIIFAVAMVVLLAVIVIVIVTCVRRRRKMKTAELEEARRAINTQAAEAEICSAENYLCLTEKEKTPNGNQYEYL